MLKLGQRDSKMSTDTGPKVLCEHEWGLYVGMLEWDNGPRRHGEDMVIISLVTFVGGRVSHRE